MTITTRQTPGAGVTAKNSPLTNAELDQNFIELTSGVFKYNQNSVESNTTIVKGLNASSIGPLVIEDGVDVIIETDASWSIL